jgi:hypothetical protein
MMQPVDDGYVGMAQGGEQLRFTLEARQPLGVLTEQLGKDLDGDAAVERGVGGLPDHAHASLPDRLEEAVVGEQVPFDRRHAGHPSLESMQRTDESFCWRPV